MLVYRLCFDDIRVEKLNDGLIKTWKIDDKILIIVKQPEMYGLLNGLPITVPYI